MEAETVTATRLPSRNAKTEGQQADLTQHQTILDRPRATASLPASITFSAQQSGSAAVQGQFNVDVHFRELPFTKTGTLDSVQITGNSFTTTGTELSQEPATCGGRNFPTSATITGQCGTGVTIQFATADGEHATFTGNVACT